jgi:hypothetical protein
MLISLVLLMRLQDLIGLQTIKIQNGCPTTQTITINAAPGVATIVDNLDVAPSSPDATIKVDITAGTGPFSYTVQKVLILIIYKFGYRCNYF